MGGYIGRGQPVAAGNDSVESADIVDDAVTNAKIATNAVTGDSIAANAVGNSELSDDAVDEANLKVSNSPTNGYALTAQSGNTGGLTWATMSSFNPDAAVVFNESGNDVDFRVESDTVTHALFVDGATGNVGIGLSNASEFDDLADMLVIGTGSGSTGLTIFTGNSSGNGGNIFFADGNSGSDRSQGRIQYNQNTNVMSFSTAATERLSIAADGNVSIGTTASNGKLNIQGSGSYNSSGWGISSDLTIRSSEMSDSAYHSILQLVSIRQSLGTGASANGFLGFSTIDDSNNTGINDALRIASVNENGTSNTSAVGMSFWTNAGGSAGNAPTEKMRINSSGNVGIGTTSPDQKLHVAGNAIVTGITRLGDGSASSPAYQFVSDTNTGMFRIGSDQLGFSTAGGQAMMINANGLVGIGTNASANNLEIWKATGASLRIQGGNNDSDAYIRMQSGNISGESYIAFGDEDDWDIGKINYLNNGNYMIFTTNASEAMRLDSYGRLALGGTAVGNIMMSITGDGSGADQAGIRFIDSNSGNDHQIYNNGGTLYFRDHSAGNTRMQIGSNGYIGINDGSPQARLNTAETGNNWVAIFDKNNNGNSTNFLIRSGASNRSTESMLHIEGNHPDCGGSSTDAEFVVKGAGDVSCDGAYSSGGADYAEYFESSTGEALTHGNTVKLNAEGKVVQCGAEETPIGVIRPDSATGVVGNNPMNWNKKYLRDDFGVLIRDADGNDQMNPDFNPELDYLMREDRPEWNAIGLMGQVPINKGQPTASSWIKMWEISSARDMWLIK
jgi:hypothetical protein